MPKGRTNNPPPFITQSLVKDMNRYEKRYNLYLERVTITASLCKKGLLKWIIMLGLVLYLLSGCTMIALSLLSEADSVDQIQSIDHQQYQPIDVSEKPL